MEHGGDRIGRVWKKPWRRQAGGGPWRRRDRGVPLPEMRLHRAAYPRHPLLHEELPQVRHAYGGSELLRMPVNDALRIHKGFASRGEE